MKEQSGVGGMPIADQDMSPIRNELSIGHSVCCDQNTPLIETYPKRGILLTGFRWKIEMICFDFVRGAAWVGGIAMFLLVGCA